MCRAKNLLVVKFKSLKNKANIYCQFIYNDTKCYKPNDLIIEKP